MSAPSVLNEIYILISHGLKRKNPKLKMKPNGLYQNHVVLVSLLYIYIYIYIFIYKSITMFVYFKLLTAICIRG
jgi:hypothetical protein